MKTKLLSLILALALLAGCTSVPTSAPTVPATATLPPTATATAQPTPTPTLEPTPTPAAEPLPDEEYPTAVSAQVVTDERLADQQAGFIRLVLAQPSIQQEALRMAERLREIGGGTAVTTEEILEGNRWGVIPFCNGEPCILQKSTDGGTTWTVVMDASAYGELIANPWYAREDYRLVPLGRPADLPEDATAEVIRQDSWLIWVWRETQTGKVLAWYDAANDQYLTMDGKKLEAQHVYHYRPISEMTSWEECVDLKQQLPWIEDPEFEEAWNAFLLSTDPVESPEQYDYFGLSIATNMFQLEDDSSPKITKSYKWNVSTLQQAEHGTEIKSIFACATMRHPDNKKPLMIIRFPVRVIPDNLVLEYNTAYAYITLAVDPNLLEQEFENTPGTINSYERQNFQIQFPGMINFGSVDFVLYAKQSDAINNEELNNPLTKPMATIIKLNQGTGAQDAIARMLNYQNTPNDLKIIHDSIFSAAYFDVRAPYSSQ